MRKLLFIAIAFFCYSLSFGQVPDRFQFIHNGKILFDTTIQPPKPIHDTLLVKLPCDSPLINPPPVAKIFGRLYIDKLSSRLGIPAEEDKIIKYTLQTGHIGWIEYTLADIIGIPAKEAQLAALHVRARAAGIKLITATSSGSASSVADRIAFNSRHPRPDERFDILNEEWEPWNQTDLKAAASKDSSQLTNQKAQAKAAGCLSEEYFGWIKKLFPFAPKFPVTLIRNTNQLPLHFYQKSITIDYHGVELDSLNAASKRDKISYNIRPIFSSELDFSQAELKGKTPAQLYAEWKALFDAKHYSNLSSDGWDMFSMSWLEVAIPFKMPATLLRRAPMLIDRFDNKTTEEHLNMAKDPDEE